MLGLGFSAGIPFLLIFSTLSLWLKEAGIDKSTITMFSWAALGYSFKFIWSPLIDSLPLPWLSTKLGRRRSWLFLAQLLIILAICMMAYTEPQAGQLAMMARAAVLLGFASATQDIVIDAYRIELAPKDSGLQAAMSAAYVAGYRLGLILAGAGSLFLAATLGSSEGHYLYQAWRNTYLIMAGIMFFCVLITLFIQEPLAHNPTKKQNNLFEHCALIVLFFAMLISFILAYRFSASFTTPDNATGIIQFLLISLRFFIALFTAICIAYLAVKSKIIPASIVQKTWVEPITDFFQRYSKSAILLLLLIGFYRVSDIVASVISNIFYADMGFSKTEIATAVKTFGVFATIFGGFIAGFFAQYIAIMRLMFIGALLSALTNLLFCAFAYIGHNGYFLYLAVGLDNLAGGFASAIFVAFLSILTNIQFTAVQYALFSSLMTLFPKILGGYSGGIVANYGYNHFFIFTTLLTLPVILLIFMINRCGIIQDHTNSPKSL